MNYIKFDNPVVNLIWEELVLESDIQVDLFDQRDVQSIDDYIADDMMTDEVTQEITSYKELRQEIKFLLLEEAYHVAVTLPMIDANRDMMQALQEDNYNNMNMNQ